MHHGGIFTRTPFADPRLRPRGHWDRQMYLFRYKILVKTLSSIVQLSDNMSHENVDTEVDT